MITLTLPYPPSVNHLYAVVHGRKVLSAKGRAYQQAVLQSLYEQQGWTRFGDQRIGYTVTAFPPDKRRRDLSNLVKVVEDALTKAGVWDDDSQVDAMTWQRGPASKGGSLFVVIESMEAA
jgi:crossover junction endodeoxyribonuclease RusA